MPYSLAFVAVRRCVCCADNVDAAANAMIAVVVNFLIIAKLLCGEIFFNVKVTFFSYTHTFMLLRSHDSFDSATHVVGYVGSRDAIFPMLFGGKFASQAVEEYCQ